MFQKCDTNKDVPHKLHFEVTILYVPIKGVIKMLQSNYIGLKLIWPLGIFSFSWSWKKYLEYTLATCLSTQQCSWLVQCHSDRAVIDSWSCHLKNKREMGWGVPRDCPLCNLLVVWTEFFEAFKSHYSNWVWWLPPVILTLVNLRLSYVMSVVWKHSEGDERWCSSLEHLFLSQNVQIHFPVPTY